MTVSSTSRYYSPIAVTLLRVVVGAVFIVSGFSKGVDPWGFIFKIEEYLGIWGINEPRTLVLTGAILLSAFEFVAGLMLASGCYRRIAPWSLTASMAFMLPLTLYIWIADPVSDCGCFGELIRLSNGATFWKNVALTIALIYLSVYNRRCRWTLYSPPVQWLAALATTIYILSVSLMGYNLQPPVDFRPYPIGTDLAALFNGNNEEDDDDEGEFIFIYEKEGESREFTIDNLPDDSWTFVDRRAIRTAASARGESFALYDSEGNDVSHSGAISSQGEQILLVIPEAERTDIAYSYSANEFNKGILASGGSMTALIGGTPKQLAQWADLAMAGYPCLTADDTYLKQLARGDMALVYLSDGVIRWKTTLSSFDFDTVDAIGRGDKLVSDISIHYADTFRLLTIMLVTFMVILSIIQEFLLRLWRKMRKFAR